MSSTATSAFLFIRMPPTHKFGLSCPNAPWRPGSCLYTSYTGGKLLPTQPATDSRAYERRFTCKSDHMQPSRHDIGGYSPLNHK